MPTTNGRLKYLFDLYQKKIASEENIRELIHLFECESEDNLEILFQEYNEQFQNENSFFSPSTSQRMLANIFSNPSELPNKISKRLIYSNFIKKHSIAAIFLITCGLGLFAIFGKHKSNEPLADEKPAGRKLRDIQPGSNRAILKLGDGSVIVLDDEKNGLLRDQKNVFITKVANGQLAFRVKSSEVDESAAQLNIIETPKGGQYQVILPDNTIAWLNAASSIQFPSAFSGKQRKVKISGEVYFEVSKNADMPFIVESKNARIEVLGTHFNVMDYADEALAKTTLLEGAVKILNGGQSGILKPGQQALYGESISLKFEKVKDPLKSIAWKNGFFEFEDSSIESVMRQVSRWYDVKVTFEGAMQDNEFTGKISRNLKLEEFLKILSYAGFNFRIEDKNLIVINH